MADHTLNFMKQSESFQAGDSSRYERIHCIGRGSFGEVYKGLDKVTGSEVAIKVIDLEDVEDDIDDIHKEISMLAGCRCQNITQYHGAVMRPSSTELMIIMELMTCSVADLVAHGPLDEQSIAFILKEVLQALIYLHAEHRIHRDIKAANILLSSQGHVKISDFGVSGQLSGTMGYRRKTFVGTPFWMAPEVIDSSQAPEVGYTEKADIWSLGITAMEMATGRPPRSDMHPMRVLFLIPKEPPPQLEGNFSNMFKDFVNLCLTKDALSRPAAKDLASHPFVANAQLPTALAEMVAEYGRIRPPLPTRSDSASIGGTMPAWDFGSKKTSKGTSTLKKADGTLKSAVLDRFMQQQPGTIKSLPITPPKPPAISPAASTTSLAAAAAAGANNVGSERTSASSVNFLGLPPLAPDHRGSRSMNHSEHHQHHRTMSLHKSASMDAHAHGLGAHAATLGTVRDFRSTSSELSRMAIAEQTSVPSRYAADVTSQESDDASTTTTHTHRTSEHYGTVQSRAAIETLVTANGTVKSSDYMQALGAAASSNPIRMPLKVEIANPNTASPDRSSNLGSSKIPAAESTCVLQRVLLPSLSAISAAQDRSIQDLVAKTQASMRELEKQLPGFCSALLQESLVRLSACSDPQLHPAKAAAAALLGGPTAAAASGGTLGTPARAVGELGSLGEFLVGKWKEEEAHEKALLARMMASSVTRL